MSTRRRGGDSEAASVFIVAASDVVRAGLAALVEADAAFTVIGSAADLGELAFEGAERPLPDVVVVDAGGRVEESVGALRSFAEGGEEGEDGGPAFVLIGVDESVWLRDALRTGLVRGLLPRGASGSEIIAAIGAVSAGLVALDAETFNALLSSPRQTSDERLSPAGAELDALTPREREVLHLLASGLSNKEVAWQMKISEHTVKSHVASIFAKLEVSTRTEAVTQGIRKGLIMM